MLYKSAWDFKGWMCVILCLVVGAALILGACVKQKDEDGSDDKVYTMSFYAQGGAWDDGADSAKVVTQTLGTPVKFPLTVPQKEGFQFAGWYLTEVDDITSTTIAPEASLVGADVFYTEDLLDAYALYRENAADGSYLVSFRADEHGAELKVITVANNAAIPSGQAPTVPARTHYTRVGADWYTRGGVFTMTSPVTENITLFPKWNAKQYTVTLDASGGEVDGASTKVYTLTFPESLPDDLPEASHPSFVFKNWNTSKRNDGAVPSKASITEDATYFAIWKLPRVNMRISVNDPSEPWKGAVVPLSISETGWYKVELWGGQGGPAGTGNPSNYSVTGYKGDNGSGLQSGGRGAYTSGHIYLREGEQLIFYVGGARVEKTDASSGGGFNGGGSGYPNGAGAGDGAGGGASDVRISGENLRHRIMVAAGGGGSADGRLGGQGSSAGLWKGGYGGGAPTHNSGKGGEAVGIASDDPGHGAALNAGGAVPTNNGQSGTWGYGGNAAGEQESYGGGGGGWFGGGSGGQWHSNGGGGGGSSYISGMDGFIACSSTAADTPKPPASGRFNNTTGGFTQGSGSVSWTGFSFTHTIALAGDEEMPTPDGGTEIGHSGPGAASIFYLGEQDVDD